MAKGMDKKRVVVTGLGIVSCFGTDVDHFYNQLLAGQSGVRPIDTFDCTEYSTRIAGLVSDFHTEGYIDKKQARRIDPYLAYSIVGGKKALEHAKLDVEALKKCDLTRAGIILGSGMGGMNSFTSGVETCLTKGHKRLTPFFIPYIITNMGGALLAMDMGFMGPNYSISTACATGNYSIIAAANHIRRGEADIMVCGGVEASVTPIGLGGFVSIKALSRRNDDPTKASRPWDQNRDGFVMGEGAGVLILESLEHAQARGATIYAEYSGGAVSCDAYHMTDPRADGEGVAQCIRAALKDSDLHAEDVDYINAHATSTPVGDMSEVHALRKVFSDTSKLKMNGTKSMIGHCLGAAGGLEAIATVKALETGILHPTINVDDPEPSLDIDIVANEAQKFDARVAISNSFGFGGHNATLVFSKWES